MYMGCDYYTPAELMRPVLVGAAETLYSCSTAKHTHNNCAQVTYIQLCQHQAAAIVWICD
jgi:hypothetical protein